MKYSNDYKEVLFAELPYNPDALCGHINRLT